MKKIFLVLLLLSFYAFGQKKPFTFSLESSFEVPEHSYTRQNFKIAGGSVNAPRKRPFTNPIFGLSLVIEKPLTKNIIVGFHTGILATLRDRIYYTNVAYRSVVLLPNSFSTTFLMNKKYKKITPLLQGNIGYTFLDYYANYNSNYIIQEYGGLSYSFRLGVLFKRKSNDIKIYLGRTTMENKVKIYDNNILSNTTYSYKEQKNSYSLTLAYTVN